MFNVLLAEGRKALTGRSWLYLLRLAAFLLILFAMWWQNRGRRAR